MIRLVHALRRKPGLSLAEFHEYWLRRHGPLLASFAEDLGILRHVQTHALEGDANEAPQRARGGNMEPHYDGVAETWWAAEGELEAIVSSEAGQAAVTALLADEAEFIDLPASPIWFAYEYPQVNPSPENVVARVRNNVVRVFYPLRQKASLTEAQARHYWLTHHGPLVRSHAEASGILCYRQVHRADTPMNERVQAARGTVVEPYLGHAEAWFDRGRAPGTDEARRAAAAAVEDEDQFIDTERSTFFFGKEHTIIDRR